MFSDKFEQPMVRWFLLLVSPLLLSQFPPSKIFFSQSFCHFFSFFRATRKKLLVSLMTWRCWRTARPIKFGRAWFIYLHYYLCGEINILLIKPTSAQLHLTWPPAVPTPTPRVATTSGVKATMAPTLTPMGAAVVRKYGFFKTLKFLGSFALLTYTLISIILQANPALAATTPLARFAFFLNFAFLFLVLFLRI